MHHKLNQTRFNDLPEVVHVVNDLRVLQAPQKNQYRCSKCHLLLSTANKASH